MVSLASVQTLIKEVSFMKNWCTQSGHKELCSNIFMYKFIRNILLNSLLNINHSELVPYYYNLEKHPAKNTPSDNVKFELIKLYGIPIIRETEQRNKHNLFCVQILLIL